MKILNEKQRETVVAIISGDSNVVSDDFLEFGRCAAIKVSVGIIVTVVTMVLLDETNFPFEVSWSIDQDGLIVEFKNQ